MHSLNKNTKMNGKYYMKYGFYKLFVMKKREENVIQIISDSKSFCRFLKCIFRNAIPFEMVFHCIILINWLIIMTAYFVRSHFIQVTIFNVHTTYRYMNIGYL